MVAPIVVAGALTAGGAALSGLGSFLSGNAAAKEQRAMREFLMRVYSNYLNDPAYKASHDFALQVLQTGDYAGIFSGMYQSALARNRANLLNAQQQMQSAAARGGFLRGGQQEDLLSRAREAAFQADTQASLESAAQQFSAKQGAAQLAESLAKGPFSAGIQTASQAYNPQLAASTSPWTTLGALGGQAANFGATLYGQQSYLGGMKDLLNPGMNQAMFNYPEFSKWGAYQPQAPLFGR